MHVYTEPFRVPVPEEQLDRVDEMHASPEPDCGLLKSARRRRYFDSRGGGRSPRAWRRLRLRLVAPLGVAARRGRGAPHSSRNLGELKKLTKGNLNLLEIATQK